MFNKFCLASKIHTVLDLNWGILDHSRALAKERIYHALSIRLNGDAIVETKKTKLHLKDNDILFVPKNTSYHLSTKKDEHVICIHFDMPNLDTTPQSFTPVDPSIFIKLFNQLNEIWTKKAIGYQYQVHSIFNEIIYNIIKQQNQLESDYHTSSKILVDKIVGYLKENFTYTDLNIKTISSEFFISETYLRRLFKKYLNISPIEYIINLRLKYATELLKSGYYTVQQTAEKCGIENVKYFSTLYKRKYGISPSLVDKP